MVRHDISLAEELDGLETDFRRKVPVAVGVPVQAAVKGALKASESRVQRAIIQRLKLRGIIAVHVPNGGSRGDIEAKQLKGDGVMAGFPDLVLIGTAGRVGFMEVKSSTGTLSEAQRVRINMLHQRGYLVAVVRDQDYAEAVVRQWGWI